jgi:hypothetical protein
LVGKNRSTTSIWRDQGNVVQQDTYHYAAAQTPRERKTNTDIFVRYFTEMQDLIADTWCITPETVQEFGQVSNFREMCHSLWMQAKETKPRNGYNSTTVMQEEIQREVQEWPEEWKVPEIPTMQYQDHKLRCREDQPQCTKQAPMGQEPKRGVPKAKRGEAPQPRRNHAHRIDHQGGLHRLHRAQNNHQYTQWKKCAWKRQCRDTRNP